MAVITLAGEEKVLPKLTAAKAIMVTDAVAAALSKAPEILDEFKKIGEEYPPLIISKKEAHLPSYKPVLERLGLIDEEGNLVAEALDEEGNIALPQAPSDEEVLARMFPLVWGTVKDDVLNILALLLVSNEDLRQADRDDNVQELLDEASDELAYNADLEELVAFVAVAIEMVAGEIKKAGVGKLLAKTRALTGQDEEPEQESESSPAPSEPEPS